MGKGDSLTTILVGSDLGDDLCRDITCCAKGMWLFDQSIGDDRAILQHVFQVYQAAVIHWLGKVIRIMEMDDAFFMRIDDVFWQ